MRTHRKRRAGSDKKRRGPELPKPSPGVCSARDCGRPKSRGGLCQTHHRQMRATGELKRIRPYRERSPGTVKFAGLRLTPYCAEMLSAQAKKRGISHGAAISEILEDWSTDAPRHVKVSSKRLEVEVTPDGQE